MIAIPAGSFMMGSNDGYDDEKPIHKVNLKAFHIGKYAVTQAQYKAVMGKNPSGFSNNSNHPVEKVSWFDAEEYCKKLSELTGRRYKLPSEAQWEYCCRAGSTTKWCFGDNEKRRGEYAWYDSNSNSQTHEVGQKKPNEWGIYDMHGNVWEWCEDYWVNNYKNTPTDGTANILQNAESQARRVLRGGSWLNYSAFCRSANRLNVNPGNDYNDYGFRVVCV
jgi:formylglycine-generating enzyme required for sulfatase activity